MKRLPNWPTLLAASLQQRHRMPFAWGSHDCCQFARQVIEAQTGEDPARGLGLRRYTTAKGALSQLRRLGGLDQLPVRAGLVAIGVRFAQRGDVVLGAVGERGDHALGICVGAKCAFAAPVGLEFRDTLDCLAAWRVG